MQHFKHWFARRFVVLTTLPKIGLLEIGSGLCELRDKKTPLEHLCNETRLCFSSTNNFLQRET